VSAVIQNAEYNIQNILPTVTNKRKNTDSPDDSSNLVNKKQKTIASDNFDSDSLKASQSNVEKPTDKKGKKKK